jgi:hypothetical protein
MGDPADLDGDGEFDAIDISIMEDGEDSGGTKNKGGCCVMFFLIGTHCIAGLIIIDYLI